MLTSGIKIELVTTKDGSHSLFRPDLNEQYHSVFGAIRESMHIFIQSGFMAVPKKNIRIFEMGFGTGLNAYLTMLQSLESGRTVKYYSIEKFPLAREIVEELNYPSLLENGERVIFRSIHNAVWDADVRMGRFTLRKIHGDLLDYDIPGGIDLVYFDAFSPEKEPALWTDSVFRKIFDSMSDSGVFVSYSAKGNVRRSLLAAGFSVEKLAGPPGKKHILRAIK